jgi:hypothetical protein
MNNLARILLLVGALVLALLVGVLLGRGHRAEPLEGNANAVQITTAPPPAPTPERTPLPASTPPPAPAPTAEVPKITPDQQVQEDAAAVGMTTRDGADDGASAPKVSTDGGNAQPPG